MEEMNRAFGWDDTIEKESEFILLPDGDYNFVIESFKRGRYEGGEKLPACNKAILSVRIEGEDGAKTTIEHNLFLHSKVEGLLSQFFIAIGQKKHGEPLRMNWDNVIGATGRCRVFVSEYTKKDGSIGKSNKIRSFIDPVDNNSTVVSAQPNKTFTKGTF